MFTLHISLFPIFLYCDLRAWGATTAGYIRHLWHYPFYSPMYLHTICTEKEMTESSTNSSQMLEAACPCVLYKHPSEGHKMELRCSATWETCCEFIWFTAIMKPQLTKVCSCNQLSMKKERQLVLNNRSVARERTKTLFGAEVFVWTLLCSMLTERVMIDFTADPNQWGVPKLKGWLKIHAFSLRSTVQNCYSSYHLNTGWWMYFLKLVCSGFQ